MLEVSRSSSVAGRSFSSEVPPIVIPPKESKPNGEIVAVASPTQADDLLMRRLSTLPGEESRSSSSGSRILKSVCRTVLNALDRPLLRPLAAVIAQGWINWRDRGLPADQQVQISHNGECWVLKQGDIYLTSDRIDWNTRPLLAVNQNLDMLFGSYVSADGDTIVCVGAGTGLDVITATQLVGFSGKVVAFEAHPRTFRCLEICCELNRLNGNNVQLHHLAASDTQRTEFIETTRHSTGNRVFIDGAGTPVAAKNLDLVLPAAEFPVIHMLVMDVEGAEVRALAGLRDVLARTKNICVECHDFRAAREKDETLRTRQQVIEILVSSGFAVATREADLRPDVRCSVYGMRGE